MNWLTFCLVQKMKTMIRFINLHPFKRQADLFIQPILIQVEIQHQR